MTDQRSSSGLPVAPTRPKRSNGSHSPSSARASHSQPSTGSSANSQPVSRKPDTVIPSRNSPAKTLPTQRQGSFDSVTSVPSVASNYFAVTDQLNARFDRVSGVTFPDSARSAPSTKSSSSSSLSLATEAVKDIRNTIMEVGQVEGPFVPLIGEEVKLTTKLVQFSCPFTDSIKSGVLTLTTFRLIFRTTSPTDYSTNFEVPLPSILTIEKISPPANSRVDNTFSIRIWCKDLRKIVLTIAKNSEQPSQKSFMDTLKQLAFPLSYKKQLFAFDYKGEYNENGWEVYDTKAEFKRQGVPNAFWRITNVNNKYELSETYPAVLAVPVDATDDLLMNVQSFRSRGRIPVLSWIHPNNRATITRSSQPLVGLNGRRSKDDESYLRLILEVSQGERLCVMDARPMVNAAANKAKGGGYESEENYSTSKADVFFLDIHNIHVMRESLRKVREMCSPRIEDPVHFYSNLEASHWLHHIKALLAGALRIVDKVETHGASVLVHCSDGWDRTAQLTSLSMLMLDPYYRTVKGFEVLIEKEWISFGHKFAHRIGHGEEKQDSDRSPIFLQFIDCVWQLTLQFETSFEFNEKFLIAILDNLYSCRYGTFLCNYEKELHEKSVKLKTVSLWSYVNSNLEDFRNPFYAQPIEDGQENVLFPLTTLRWVQLWMRYYARWDPSTKQQEPVEERYKQLIYSLRRLTDYRDDLRREATSKKIRQPSSGNPTGNPLAHVTGPVHV